MNYGHKLFELVVSVLLSFFLGAQAFARETKAEKEAKAEALRTLIVAVEEQRLSLALSKTSTKGAVRVLQDQLQQFRAATKQDAAVEAVLVRSELARAIDLLGEKASNEAVLAKQEAALRAAVEGLYSGFEVELAPSRTPDFVAARALYRQQCASCHGVTGAADGELAKKLPTAPPSFLDPERMARVTPAYFYNAIALGKPARGMPGYGKRLDPHMVWSLSHYIAALRHGGAELAMPPAVEGLPKEIRSRLEVERLTLTDLASYHDTELGAKLEAAALKAARLSVPFATTTPRGKK